MVCLLIKPFKNEISLKKKKERGMACSTLTFLVRSNILSAVKTLCNCTETFSFWTRRVFTNCIWELLCGYFFSRIKNPHNHKPKGFSFSHHTVNFFSCLYGIISDRSFTVYLGFPRKVDWSFLEGKKSFPNEILIVSLSAKVLTKHTSA